MIHKKLRYTLSSIKIFHKEIDSKLITSFTNLMFNDTTKFCANFLAFCTEEPFTNLSIRQTNGEARVAIKMRRHVDVNK